MNELVFWMLVQIQESLKLFQWFLGGASLEMGMAIYFMRPENMLI